jgi:glycosyltransferase involved in cell wall biosynthesis
MMTGVAVFSLVCAAIPALMFWRNRAVYRPLPRGGAEAPPFVSVLIPARNEEAVIGAAVRAAWANGNCEVLVGDDHSTDRTAELARQAGATVIAIPPLPAGWCGKQHACAVLARRAAQDLLVFVDADVRLAPDALARMTAFLEAAGADLISGIPRQETVTFGEKLLIPQIHFLLLGFLPLRRMRARRHPAYGAGCGQLFMARRAAYEAAGGHEAIRETRHDGVRLPRAFRAAGLKTDLFDATDVATCRMYRSGREVWRGLMKNATEGLGAPRMIGPATVVLLAGQVLPFFLVWNDCHARLLALIAIPLVFYPRVAAARQFGQSVLSVLLHPVGVVALVTIQWVALVRQWLGRPADWKGRAYVASAPAN